MDVEELRSTLDRKLADRRLAVDVRSRERAKLSECRDRLRHSLEAQALIQDVAQKVQETAHARIAGVVTSCLRAVFGDSSYEFAIRFDKKRSRTEARLVFLRDGEEIDPTTAAGGGAVDVAAFALRLVALSLRRPPVRRLLLCDEPLRFLSADYRPAARELFEALARDMGVQMVFVTHSDELVCGKVIRLD